MSKLKAMRLRRKLKLRELAALCGVTTATVHDTETSGIKTARIVTPPSLAATGKICWINARTRA